MVLKVIDLFAGGGGFSYGFKWAGYKVVFANDVDKDVAKTYKYNFPDTVFIIKDIHLLDPKSVLQILDLKPGEIEVMVAGPPCQGFSLMGLRNPHDPRNKLLPELLRFIKVIKPMWIVIENVPGLLSMEGGEPVRKLYSGLQKLGYKVKHKILNAVNYGVPQRRKRVFFIANNTGDPITFPPPSHYDGKISTLDKFFDGISGNPKPAYTVRDAIGDLPRLKPGETKDYYASEPFSEYQKIMREGAPPKLHNHTAPNHTPAVVERIKKAKPGEKIPYRYPFEKRRLKWDQPAPTLLDGPRPTWHYAHPEDDRGLSVRERARIASFPDKFIFQGSLPVQRRITGEAVPPLLSKAIAEEIKKYL